MKSPRRDITAIVLALVAWLVIVRCCHAQQSTMTVNPQLATNIVYSSASLLKNGDVGLDTMYRWNSTWSYSNRPAFFWCITDQSLTTQFWEQEAVRQGRPHEGGLGSGFSDVGSLRINTNGQVYKNQSGSTVLDPANITFTGDSWWNITNGATITWDRIGSGTGITDTNHYCDTFKLFYLTEPNAGTFLLQTNISGGGWNTMRTINANNGSTQAFVTNFTLTAGYYAFRVQGSTGTNRIWDAAVYNSTAKNFVPIVLSDAGGASFTTITNATNVFFTFLTNWGPDLMIFQDTGGPANGPAVKYLDPLIPVYATNADRIYVGWYSGNYDTTVAAGNYQLQQFAITNAQNVGYFDVSQLISQGDITDLTNKGIISTDLVHLTPTLGVNLLDQMLWNRVMRTYVSTNADPNFRNLVNHDWTVVGNLAATGSLATVSIYGRNTSGSQSQIAVYSPDGHVLNFRDNTGGAEMFQFSNNLAGVTWFQPGGNQATEFGSSLRPWSSGWFTNSLGGRLPATTKTVNYTVLLTDQFGTFFNNTGAGAAQTNTLPAATAGLHFGANVDAAQFVCLRAAGSDTIRNAASVSTAGGGIFANTVGNNIHIICHVNGKWVVDSVIGTWTTF